MIQETSIFGSKGNPQSNLILKQFEHHHINVNQYNYTTVLEWVGFNGWDLTTIRQDWVGVLDGETPLEYIKQFLPEDSTEYQSFLDAKPNPANKPIKYRSKVKKIPGFKHTTLTKALEHFEDNACASNEYEANARYLMDAAYLEFIKLMPKSLIKAEKFLAYLTTLVVLRSFPSNKEALRNMVIHLFMEASEVDTDEEFDHYQLLAEEMQGYLTKDEYLNHLTSRYKKDKLKPTWSTFVNLVEEGKLSTVTGELVEVPKRAKIDTPKGLTRYADIEDLDSIPCNQQALVFGGLSFSGTEVSPLDTICDAFSLIELGESVLTNADVYELVEQALAGSLGEKEVEKLAMFIVASVTGSANTFLAKHKESIYDLAYNNYLKQAGQKQV